MVCVEHLSSRRPGKVAWVRELDIPPKSHVIQEEVYHPGWKDTPEGVYPPERNIIQIELVNKVGWIRKLVGILKLG